GDPHHQAVRPPLREEPLHLRPVRNTVTRGKRGQRGGEAGRAVGKGDTDSTPAMVEHESGRGSRVFLHGRTARKRLQACPGLALTVERSMPSSRAASCQRRSKGVSNSSTSVAGTL